MSPSSNEAPTRPADAAPAGAAEEIIVTYRVRTPASGLAERVEALLLEQTVELPRRALHTAFVREHLVGRVVATERVGGGGGGEFAADTDTDVVGGGGGAREGGHGGAGEGVAEFRVTLAQPAAATAGDPAQLLNVLFGNSSLQPDVVLEDVQLPESLVRRLGGPRFGTAGLRVATDVTGRALTASALKPMGLTVDELAALCGTFARAGLDLVKDDHGLADHAWCPFEARVRACLAATAEAAQETGRRTLYVPNLIGTPADVARQARVARDLGVGAVMVSPMLVGLPLLNELVRDLGVPVLAHPAWGGALRIAPVALLAKLFPLFGADAVIYPNFGGRFSYSRDVCAGIAAELRRPGHAIAPTLPVPAGGMKTGNVPAVLEFYGSDTVLLIGGSLLESPTAEVLLERSRQFVSAVQASGARA